MRVEKFQVERYRSIERSESIDLTELSVLVGPNNEGKSNILRALVVALRALEPQTQAGYRRVRNGILHAQLHGFESYDWENDFPIRLQGKTPGAYSKFEIEFELNASEVAAFRQEVGSHLNGKLKLRVLLGREGRAQIKVVKSGKGSDALNKNVEKVAGFVARRLQVEYIPVARTHRESMSIVQREVSNALRQAMLSEKYAHAMSAISDVFNEALEPLESWLREAVSRFVPNVISVTVHGEIRDPLPSSADLRVSVDDGQDTLLSAKGDGVQSLVSLALVRALAQRRGHLSYVLAVEEPESHLHPGAIHQLRAVLLELAAEHQVILTTHSPILVRRDAPSSNILVTGNRAAPASSLEAVRESLGVLLPDNMAGAETLLIVEGRSDQTLVKHLLSRSEALAGCLRDGRLHIVQSEGAAKVPYQFNLARQAACNYHIFLDDDKEGRLARRKIDEMGVLPVDVTMITIPGMSEAELEDLFDEGSYSGLLLDRFNVSLEASHAPSGARFSRRMKDQFAHSGQPWNDSVAVNVKNAVCDHLAQQNGGEVRSEAQGVISALRRALEKKLRLVNT